MRSGYITILMPSYNTERYIAEAIESVLAQTYHNWELLVVNDGSTDGTARIAAQFADSRIKLIHQPNQGLAGARNTGLRTARSELIALLDADDEWLPTFLATMVALANSHPRGTVYYCSAQSMDANGHDLPEVFGGPPVASRAIYQRLLRMNFLIPSTILLRRSDVMAVGCFDQTLRSCEDWDLWLRLLPRHLFVGTDKRLVRYRLHGSSLSKNLIGMHQAAKSTIEKNFGIDDGQRTNWSLEKQRAYGGLYCYFALTFVQRQDNWQDATQYLNLALQVDPTLATDLDLFYGLALGSQPPGYRGSVFQLDLENNVASIETMLDAIFVSCRATQLMHLRSQTYGTAYYALGLVAYNTGKLPLSRSFLLQALRYRPDLWRAGPILSTVMKSVIGQSNVNRLAQLRRVSSIRRTV